MNILVGKNIRKFRIMRGMKQRELGIAAGFSAGTASIRIAQYENGSRSPKPVLLKRIAESLNVSEDALTTPDLEGAASLMHTLFALEDTGFFGVLCTGGDVELWSDTEDNDIPLTVRIMLKAWAELHHKYLYGEISKEEYDQWRYNFPNIPKNESELI